MRKYVLMAAALLVASPAVAQSLSEKSGVNSALGVSPSTNDFAKQVAVSDMFEIESSKLALERADTKSKSFAAKMVKDHSGTTAELKAIASRAKLELPTALDSAHQSKLDKLASLQGADFDKEYDSQQLAAHKDAVDLFQRYAKGGDNPDLKKFAAKHLPHLAQHLKLAQGLQSQTQSPRKR